MYLLNLIWNLKVFFLTDRKNGSTDFIEISSILIELDIFYY
jgi:hypothetical protein